MDNMNVLPLGFRFHPTDEELINDYLRKKVSNDFSDPFVSIIAEIDLYRFDPHELPAKAYFGEKEWFFYSPRERKYPNGSRPNRVAASGYWKATGTDKPIISQSWCIGLKKALVFYEGRPPNGIKTNWMMYEYRLQDNNNYHQTDSLRLDDWVLCRVRQKTEHQEPEAMQEETKRKTKRSASACNDELDGTFMEDENVRNISFVQRNAWPSSQQDNYYSQDHTLILDFEEGTSSAQFISYDDFDVQEINANGTDKRWFSG